MSRRLLPIVDALKGNAASSRVEVHGWVRSLRRQKRVSFLELNDGSSSQTIQVVTSSELLPKDISVGSSVRAAGSVRESGVCSKVCVFFFVFFWMQLLVGDFGLFHSHF